VTEPLVSAVPPGTKLRALFMTEEGIRNLVGELKLPKELIGSVLAQADRTKQEVLRVMTEELRNFLRSPVLREEFLDLLTDATLEVKAEFKLRRSATGLTPEVREEPKISMRPTTRRKPLRASAATCHRLARPNSDATRRAAVSLTPNSHQLSWMHQSVRGVHSGPALGR
jgi:hypothetical protein